MSKAEAWVLVDKDGERPYAWQTMPFSHVTFQYVSKSDQKEAAKLDERYPNRAPFRWAHLTEQSSPPKAVQGLTEALRLAEVALHECPADTVFVTDWSEAAMKACRLLAAVSGVQVEQQPMASYPRDRFTEAQWKWCLRYERETGFEPLMCDYIAGLESFVDAAKNSASWYEGHTSDAYLRITDGEVPRGVKRRAAPPQDKLPQDFDEQQGGKESGNG